MRVLKVLHVRDVVALCVVFSGLWLGNPAVGAVITVPTGLSVGDQYRLVFVTSTVHNALSSDISTYNTIVDALGDTAIASDWKVIGSTATVDAIDNTATPITTSGVSIWRLDDVKIADDYADLWDGIIDNAIRVDELGADQGTGQYVFTGGEGEGRGRSQPNTELGSIDEVSVGRIRIDEGAGHSDWIQDAFGWGPNDELRLLGMSGVLTVQAAAVPEPSSAILLGLVAVGGLIRSRRKRRQASSAA